MPTAEGSPAPEEGAAAGAVAPEPPLGKEKNRLDKKKAADKVPAAEASKPGFEGTRGKKDKNVEAVPVIPPGTAAFWELPAADPLPMRS